MSWNHVKAATSFFYSEKSFVKKRSKQQQFACCSYHCTQPLVQNFTISCLWSEFSAQLSSKLNIFPFFARVHVQVQWNPRFSLWSLKACNSLFWGPDNDLLLNWWKSFKDTISFDDIVNSNDEEEIVTYVDFDCGFKIYPEAPTKVEQINPERKNFSRTCKTQVFPRQRSQPPPVL